MKVSTTGLRLKGLVVRLGLVVVGRCHARLEMRAFVPGLWKGHLQKFKVTGGLVGVSLKPVIRNAQS